MLTSKEQMEIIKGALSKDYKGPIFKLVEQATIQKQEALAKQQQQEQPQQRETGGLVQSYDSQPPSLENLPTGDKLGKDDMIENAGKYKDGGLLQNVGDGTSSMNKDDKFINANPDGDIASRVTKGAYGYRKLMGDIIGSLDYGDAAKEYAAQIYNPKKWFDGKSASQAAYNELVPINARALMEDAQDNALFNKNNPIGKYSPLSYLPQSVKGFLGNKTEITEKDLSIGELEVLKKRVSERNNQTDNTVDPNDPTILDYSDYGENASIPNSSLIDKVTNPDLVLKTFIGYGGVTETDTSYNLTDTFDFNVNNRSSKLLQDGKIADNPYNQLRWNIAPKYLSPGNTGSPVNITMDKDEDKDQRKTGGFVDRKVLYNKANSKKIKKRKRLK